MGNRSVARAIAALVFIFAGFHLTTVFADNTGDYVAGSPSNYLETAAARRDGATLSSGDTSAELGNSDTLATPVLDESSTSEERIPSISDVLVHGEFNRAAAGVDYFNNISISLIADNLTDDNFLTPEGLHWSDKTRVELIHGEELGDFDFSTFSAGAPQASVRAFRMNEGDSGRITYVGTTKSGIELDLIWTVIGSDQEDWEANSGYEVNPYKGLGFTGEQYFHGARGNAISVLYNRASNLGLHYQIVRHNTTHEQPVVASFISTDIDSAQGVVTDLANLVEIIPEESHLTKQDGIIYDTTPDAENLNGSVDLPRGGYLGAGFLSSFTYVFYSPAPQRVADSYAYPRAVRYDLFGTSLQAKLLIRMRQHIVVRYVDSSGVELKAEEHYLGLSDERYSFRAASIDNYQLLDIQKDESDPTCPVLTFVYTPLHNVCFHFVDEDNNKLIEDKHVRVLSQRNISYVPPLLAGYELPDTFVGTITQDTEHSFVYKKIITLDKPDAAQPAHSAQAQNEGNASASHIPSARHTYPKSTHPKPHGIREGSVSHILQLKSDVASSAQTEPVDPFLVNTGMTKEQKERFLAYIAEAERQGREKYSNNQAQVNHTVDNWIAYPVYATNMLQSLVNDFGDTPRVGNYGDVYKNLWEVHRDQKYKIDFPHLFTTLASMKKSSYFKEALKLVVGRSPSVFWGIAPDDNFFQLNSFTGDLLTTIDTKDRNTDIDAFIFQYHPDYKNLSDYQKILKHYHIKNLDTERERLYQEVLKLQAGPAVSAQEQEMLNVFFAAATLGGVGVALSGLFSKARKEFESFRENPHTYAMQAINGAVTSMQAGVTSFVNNPLGFIKSHIISPVLSAGLGAVTLGGALVRKLGGNVYEYGIKPVAQFVDKHIVKPVGSFLKDSAKSITRLTKSVTQAVSDTVSRSVNVVKKARASLYHNVVKPIIKAAHTHVVKPVVNKVIKPVVRFVNKHVVQPIVKNVIKPVSNFVNNNILKPAAGFIHSITKSFMQKPAKKKIVKPAHKQAKPVRSASLHAKKKTSKTTSRTTKKKATQSARKYSKQLRR
ncbi:MucBP domain-containing protein [Collinsella sp. zg1085]|uniref:MucBP domain-containing protein n=1 Tax=Collinsella sp. zg1085 TaxID=2844380 RepID=UPI001C0DB380|nr:MucBP domain-containing protein [Collinsella sp. zg1085]QWT17113.1 MucBP domain-containing protein [Collinsella sp. zg1085]